MYLCKKVVSRAVVEQISKTPTSVDFRIEEKKMIEFESKNVELPALDYNRVSVWLELVAASHDRRVGNVNYLFCDDAEILRVNNEFLGHDYFTDIITFDYTHRDKIGGDIFISLDTVCSNSKLVGDDYESELLRVIAHGVLHLCGIDDKGPGEREIMEANEDAALEMWRSDLIHLNGH